MHPKITLDVHTHTIMSGHAFSSLQEMVIAGQQKELDILGITEHASSLPGACAPIYFCNMHVVPRQWQYKKANGTDASMRLLMGIELNILDTKGTLDYDDFYHRQVDFCIAGIHSLVYQHGSQDEETEGMIAAIHNPHVQIISHPGDGTANLLFEPIVLAAKESNTLLEINNSSLKPIRGKKEARGNNLELLRLCKKYEVPVILGSDAHISFDIANYDSLWPLLRETDFPEDLIINFDAKRFLDFTGIDNLDK